MLHTTLLSCPAILPSILLSCSTVLQANSVRYHGLLHTNCLGCLFHITLLICPGLLHSTMPSGHAPRHTPPRTCASLLSDFTVQLHSYHITTKRESKYIYNIHCFVNLPNCTRFASVSICRSLSLTTLASFSAAAAAFCMAFTCA